MNQAVTVVPTTINRRLAAIAFADVAGYSRLMAVDDVETVRRWKALRTEIMQPHMVRHGGRVAEIAGDALLVEFASVVNAVRWAADVQRTMHGAQSDKNPLHLRIGINVEDVIDEDGILQGDGVNIASRIHQAAEPGQIVVTAAVRDYVKSRLPLVFHDLGMPPMKNINRPVRVFAIEWVEGGKSDLVVQPYLQWSSRPTVAVLPFRTIGGTEDDDYYGDGITNEIISGLSRSRALYVIARSSTLRYRTREKDLRQIASELDVRYVLNGSVQRQKTRLRINCELIDVGGDRPIWTERFQGSTDELFSFRTVLPQASSVRWSRVCAQLKRRASGTIRQKAWMHTTAYSKRLLCFIFSRRKATALPVNCSNARSRSILHIHRHTPISLGGSISALAKAGLRTLLRIESARSSSRSMRSNSTARTLSYSPLVATFFPFSGRSHTRRSRFSIGPWHSMKTRRSHGA